MKNDWELIKMLKELQEQLELHQTRFAEMGTSL
jgi:hypothetical protein